MRLLLTNDDGIHCEGILKLADYLSKEHEVWIVAPDSNRSASSHCITMFSPLCIKNIAERRYTCSGLPADCVITALKGLMQEKPDAVISGINKGANLGSDVLYSGTAAAARQAVLLGVPGIALSIETTDGSWNYDGMVSFVSKNITQLISLCGDGIFVNVNALSASKYQGTSFTKLAKRHYCDTVQLFHAKNGNSFSVFCGGDVLTYSEIDGDYNAVQKNCVSISRVYAEPIAAEYNDYCDMVFDL